MDADPTDPSALVSPAPIQNTLTGALGAPRARIESSIALFGGKTYTLPIGSNSSARPFPLKNCSSTGKEGSKKLALLIVNLSVDDFIEAELQVEDNVGAALVGLPRGPRVFQGVEVGLVEWEKTFRSQPGGGRGRHSRIRRSVG